jgi:hypothetical protein
MLEVLNSYQALEYTLDLRDRIERATTPLEVPELIAEGIRAIGGDEEGVSHLSIRLSDRLEDVLKQVATTYKLVVIPRDYGTWWGQAQEELKDLIERCTRDIDKLGAMPCATRRQRRKVRAEHFYVSLYEQEMPYQATIDDAATFARWKATLERALRDCIEDFRRVEQRLRENRPVALATEATGVGGHEDNRPQ